MGLLFLIFGFRAEPVLSAEAAPVSLKPCPSSPNCVSSLALGVNRKRVEALRKAYSEMVEKK